MVSEATIALVQERGDGGLDLSREWRWGKVVELRDTVF